MAVPKSPDVEQSDTPGREVVTPAIREYRLRKLKRPVKTPKWKQKDEREPDDWDDYCRKGKIPNSAKEMGIKPRKQ